MANNHDDTPLIQDGSDVGSDAGSDAGSEGGAIVPVIQTPWQMYAPFFADEVALRDAMYEKAYKPCCICGKAGHEVRLRLRHRRPPCARAATTTATWSTAPRWSAPARATR